MSTKREYLDRFTCPLMSCKVCFRTVHRLWRKRQIPMVKLGEVGGRGESSATPRSKAVKRFLFALMLPAGLFGCGDLGSTEIAPGEFLVHGDGVYGREADVLREAKRVCPDGFTKKSEQMTKGTADFGGGPLWDIVCASRTSDQFLNGSALVEHSRQRPHNPI